MPKMKLQPITSAPQPNKIVGYRFFCPGCKEAHHYWITYTHPGSKNHVWGFNGDLEAPTFSPSLLRKSGPTDNPQICHLTLTSGLFHFYDDSTHELSGKQDIPMEEYPMSPEKNDSPSLEQQIAALQKKKADADETAAFMAVAEAKRKVDQAEEAEAEAEARELGMGLSAPESGGVGQAPEDTDPEDTDPEDTDPETVEDIVANALRTFEDLDERERLNVLYASLIRIARSLSGSDEKVSNPLLGL